MDIYNKMLFSILPNLEPNLFRIDLPKTDRYTEQVVNRRHQTPQGQPVIQYGIALQKILVANVNPMELNSVAESSIVYFHKRSEGRYTLGRGVIADILSHIYVYVCNGYLNYLMLIRVIECDNQPQYNAQIKCNSRNEIMIGRSNFHPP